MPNSCGRPATRMANCSCCSMSPPMTRSGAEMGPTVAREASPRRTGRVQPVADAATLDLQPPQQTAARPLSRGGGAGSGRRNGNRPNMAPAKPGGVGHRSGGGGMGRPPRVRATGSNTTSDVRSGAHDPKHRRPFCLTELLNALPKKNTTRTHLGLGLFGLRMRLARGYAVDPQRCGGCTWRGRAYVCIL